MRFICSEMHDLRFETLEKQYKTVNFSNLEFYIKLEIVVALLLHIQYELQTSSVTLQLIIGKFERKHGEKKIGKT